MHGRLVSRRIDALHQCFLVSYCCLITAVIINGLTVCVFTLSIGTETLSKQCRPGSDAADCGV